VTSTDPAPAPAPRSRRSDAVRNRQRIVTAAAALFAADGLSVSIADVARAAGVGTGTVGRHFETKTELIQAALADPIVEVIARADRTDRLEPMAALHEVFRSMVEAAAAHRGLGDALAGLGGWEVTAALHQIGAADFRRVLDRTLIRAARSGALRDDITATQVLQLAIACIKVHREEGRRSSEITQDIVLRGLRR
jgi:AcrR family transcriptional regulator